MCSQYRNANNASACKLNLSGRTQGLCTINLYLKDIILSEEVDLVRKVRGYNLKNVSIVYWKLEFRVKCIGTIFWGLMSIFHLRSFAICEAISSSLKW